MLALGFSINVLTMFGMVLVIGIVVDDAIVVVENVERIMSEEGLPPRAATRKAMGQIQGAIVGVTVVLVSVFVPLAFFSGSIGNIYRQFSTVMLSSISLSAFMAQLDSLAAPDRKTHELIRMVCTVILRNNPGVERHAMLAREVGATWDEIAGAILLTIPGFGLLPAVQALHAARTGFDAAPETESE